jgi:hypothetical protein
VFPAESTRHLTTPPTAQTMFPLGSRKRTTGFPPTWFRLVGLEEVVTVRITVTVTALVWLPHAGAPVPITASMPIRPKRSAVALLSADGVPSRRAKKLSVPRKRCRCRR